MVLHPKKLHHFARLGVINLYGAGLVSFPCDSLFPGVFGKTRGSVFSDRDPVGGLFGGLLFFIYHKPFCYCDVAMHKRFVIN